MKITIRYFASLREITGQQEEQLTVQEGASVADVRALLLERYPRSVAVLERSACAVNRTYATAETALHEGDEMAFIPPVGGGTMREKLCKSQ